MLSLFLAPSIIGVAVMMSGVWSLGVILYALGFLASLIYHHYRCPVCHTPKRREVL